MTATKLIDESELEALDLEVLEFQAQVPGGRKSGTLSASARKMRMLKRLHCGLKYERAARAEGAQIIAGVDEVGRGALFGPVVAAAVILPEGCRIRGLRDSKQLE